MVCLDGRNQLKTVSVEGDSLVGKTIGAAMSPTNPFVAGMVTRATVFQEVQRQFRTEFAGLDHLNALEYLRVRLMPVSQERFQDRLLHFRPVTKCISVVFVFVILDVAGLGVYVGMLPCHIGFSLVVSFLFPVYTIGSGLRCGVGEGIGGSC